MRRIVFVILLTVMSSSASAEVSPCVRAEINVLEGAIAENDELDELMWAACKKTDPCSLDKASCDEQFKYIEDNYHGNDRIKKAYFAVVSKACKEGDQLTEARYRLAEQSGSYLAKQWFIEKKEAELKRYMQTKPYLPKLGMNQREASESSFGKPQNEEKLTTNNGTTFLWTYKWGGSLVFDDCGKLAVIYQP